jgi:hypothetical protein
MLIIAEMQKIGQKHYSYTKCRYQEYMHENTENCFGLGHNIARQDID